ncbi:S-adenosyl-L-methionine-dependent methyltransferase [Plenodomus tracheiphilus IPT5]|uniref:S-adenosyl-L-methionine-dependent methyltransferase n=1 Tax=Plenodomus tracheiphilus IPT5 TaxID=1408161 RepID=A0A6A7AM05_9PLEO|nr:S-adenosyl-L-methionine-dependent methyltransferase [Plenodomus tracheiphilus IPT5]
MYSADQSIPGGLITSTANRVSHLADSIAVFLQEKGMSQPDFSTTSSTLPNTSEYKLLRDRLNDAIQDLYLLSNGPLDFLRTFSWSVVDLAALRVALSFKMFEIVPNNSEGLTVKEIADKANLEQDRTGRILKMLATYRIFEEDHGRFRHTAQSEFLRTSSFTAMVDAVLDDCYKGASEMDTAFRTTPGSTLREDNSPFYCRFKRTFYDYYDEHSEKGLRFSKAMSAWSLFDNSFAVLRDNFNWKSLENKKIVDVGGGNGGISAQLAREFVGLTFVVQDRSAQQLSSDFPTDVQNRITFQVANYLDCQPVHDAGVYLLRNVFHNNNDGECARILRALLPALDNRSDSARLLINDCVVPPCAGGNITRSEERGIRQLDLMMMTLFGAKERTVDDWRCLLQSVDKRLNLKRVYYNAQGAGLLEVCLHRS